MDLIERLLELVRIDSVIGNEKPLCDFLEQRLTACTDYEIQRVGNSFAMRPRRRDHARLVALVGHLDTVPPSGDNPARIEGDRLCGLGSSDMKSGVALMWDLLENPPERPAYDLAFIFYDGEEGPYEGSGLGPLMSEVGWLAEIDLALCLEPSDNVLQLGCLGTIHAELTFRGRAAHSARPWQGQNAIHEASGLLARVAALEPVDVRFESLCYREVFSLTTARGGSARNVVPDAFSLNLNYRFAPGRTLASAQKQIEELVGGEAEIRWVDLSPSGDIPRENQVLERFRRTTGVDIAPKQAWTDVARFSTRGIDAVNFGPGENAMAHQPDESTSIALMRAGDRLLRRFLTATGEG